MGKIPGRTPALSRPTPEKTPENQAWKNLARPLRRCLQRSGHKRGIPAAKQERRKKMEQETTNLFRRKDTFFGICEAVGRDFGFNPPWLRLAFLPPLFIFPMDTIAAYLGLGVVVPPSPLLFPFPASNPPPPRTTH